MATGNIHSETMISSRNPILQVVSQAYAFFDIHDAYCVASWPLPLLH